MANINPISSLMRIDYQRPVIQLTQKFKNEFNLNDDLVDEYGFDMSPLKAISEKCLEPIENNSLDFNRNLDIDVLLSRA
tara:strand:+ start:90 stop:326 length:237 start_codon:yes stop_codon:yes gene_type:complete